MQQPSHAAGTDNTTGAAGDEWGADHERARLRDLLLQAPAAIAILRGPDLIFDLANERFRQLIGGRDVVGKSVADALPEVDIAPFVARLRAALASGTPLAGSEVPVSLDRNGDGALETAYFNFVYEPIRRPDGSAEQVFIHAVDVTDQVLSQRRLEAVLEQLPIGVIIAEAPSGRLLLGNRAVEQIWRHPFRDAAAVGEHSAYLGFHPDERPYRPDEWPLARAIASGETVRDERVLIARGDGTRGWITVSAAPIRDAGGAVIAGVAVFADVTERRRAADERAQLLAAERAARERAERAVDRTARLLAVTAALADAVTREDAAAVALREGIAAVGATAGGLGMLTTDGERLERLALLGYPEELAESTRFATLDDLGPIATTARTGEAVWLETNAQIFAKYPQLAAIPERRQYGAAVSAPLTVGGRVIGVMSLRFAEERPFDADDRDLIGAIAGQCAQALERAQLFDAERAARAEAEDAVHARDEFLSIAAHELRTPVAALKGSAQLLLRRQARGEVDAERLTRSLTIVNDTADRLTVLTGDLLDVSRLRSGRLTLTPEPLDLVALTRAVIERMREQTGDGREITLAGPGALGAILADPTRIDQVLANLLDNALKYSPAGGEVAVTLAPDAGGALISVRDSGIGLPPGAAESIFEPFGRAANASRSGLPGMGLGLYISRGIVAQHAGRVWAESAGEGHGTTVFVWLPGATGTDNRPRDA